MSYSFQDGVPIMITPARKKLPSATETLPSAPKTLPSAPKTLPSAPKALPSAPKTLAPACKTGLSFASHGEVRVDDDILNCVITDHNDQI